MNPPINFFALATATPDCFSSFLVADVRCASAAGTVGITLILRLTSNAEARVNAVLLQAEQQLARSLQITKPRLLERQQLREQRLQRQRQRQFTRDWQSALEALAALLPEHALADNDKLAAGNAGDQGADNKHYRVKRTRNVTTPGCFFSSQSAGGATQQDAQGRWQFEYQLTRKVSDGHAL